MKRLLLAATLVWGLLGLATYVTPPAEAQIGYGFSGSADDLSWPLTSATVLAADEVALAWGTDSDFTMTFSNASSVFTMNDGVGSLKWRGLDSSSYYFQFSGNDGNIPTIGADTAVVEVAASLGAQNGSDLFRALTVDLTNSVSHTGSTNFIYGISVETVTGHANSSEYAIYVEDGWDRELVFASGATIQTLAAGTTWVVPAGNAFQISNGGAAIFSVNDSNTASILATTGDFNGTSSLAAADITFTINAMDGSDTNDGVLSSATHGTHTGTASTNIYSAFRAENDANQANSYDYAFSANSNFDATVFADSQIRMRAVNAFRVDDGSGNQIWTTNAASSVSEMAFTRNVNGTALGYVRVEGTYTAQDGSDEVSFFQVDDFTDAAHTGTGNIMTGFSVEAITSPDTNMLHTALRTESGWDAFALVDVDTGGWGAADDPPTNSVAIYVDESADRGAGTGTADCAVIVRLPSGTEIALTPVLVTDGGC
jgi:hypothetical protein